MFEVKEVFILGREGGREGDNIAEWHSMNVTYYWGISKTKCLTTLYIVNNTQHCHILSICYVSIR